MTVMKFDLGSVHPDPCALCGADLILKDSKYGLFYGCSNWAIGKCKGGVGAHPNGTPLGPPANAELKAARIRAHEKFDTLWKGDWSFMTRGNAYKAVAEKLGKPEVHIAWTKSVEECESIISVVEELKNEAGAKNPSRKV